MNDYKTKNDLNKFKTY